jgi:hypothetical protein
MRTDMTMTKWAKNVNIENELLVLLL